MQLSRIVSWTRAGILGITILILGINLSGGTLIFLLVGGPGPLTLVEVLFWGGLVMNFVGFGILMISYGAKRKGKKESKND